ncbi:EXS family-domain-containing protein [Mycena sp. CBHHK59/15]|nr:EXS family-domain-containing protein [Mycena sp. CBHHK59/15]
MWIPSWLLTLSTLANTEQELLIISAISFGDTAVDITMPTSQSGVYSMESTQRMPYDFLMDWSILRPHARYFLLRQELVYTNHLPLYYFAIVSNTLIRFTWILYIPTRGPDMMFRSFIVGLLEIVRRLQWNFYRLENEHLGNVDQYRVTREVPLPYSLEVRGDGDEEDVVPEKSEWVLRVRCCKYRHPPVCLCKSFFYKFSA